ncbi:type VII secretion protein EccB [Catellatospora bangladeshensis]|uniref:Type VII secretion protein EccB n=1 Tax=Catellatospora bangladeshensis TaxID=310355 RepID=A0A8J3JDK9_9ACTN|nr:type VII secretion protein EccB [Catellatospora bangladeshensis]GIF82431.1 type VII secretion protein EccB [Catellatospora bangladeshensis]
MPSRQDQLHSYQFTVQRVVSALVMRDTDPAQAPFKRAAGATLASVLLAVVIAAGFGVYGVFSGRGDTKWKADGTVVVEEKSGAHFVYREGRLYPALNLTSALLASGVPAPTVMTVARKSLAGVPRGLTVGIADLPDSLPDPGTLLGLPWSVCAAGDAAKPTSVLVVGDTTMTDKGRAMGGEEALFVRAADRRYLLWHGRLYDADPDELAALAGGAQPLAVPVGFINGMPKGQPLDPPRVDDPGKVSSVRGLTNGQVIKIKGLDGKTSQYAVVQPDGLAMVTQVQAALALGRYRAGREIEINQTELAEYDGSPANLVPNRDDPRQPPANMPTIASYAPGALCAVIRDDQGTVEVRAEVVLDLSTRIATVGRSAEGGSYADYVLVPGGRGAIVASGTTLSLVTDQGVRYDAARPDVLPMLGYANPVPLRLPSALVDLLPAGPGLDPQAASAQLALG